MKRHSKKRNLDLILDKLIFPLALFKMKRKFPKTIKKIIVLKFSGIGDSILTLPAINQLSKKGYKIEVACSKENELIFRGQKFIKKVHSFDIEKSSKINFIKFINNLKKEKYNLCIDTSQSSLISAFAAGLISKYSIGFRNLKSTSRNKFFDELIEMNPNKHMVINYYDLLSRFKLKKSLRLISPKVSKRPKKLKDLIKSKNLIGIHATGPLFYKNWPKQNYVETIDSLLDKNYSIILFGGPKEIKDNEEILGLLKSRNKKDAINLCGKITLEEMFYLLPKLKFFLANDGGPMHIAASFNIPVVGIFGAETPLRYAPFNKKSYSIYKPFKNGPIIKAYELNWPNENNYETPNKISIKEVLNVVRLLEGKNKIH
jgi:heptosyltransferase-2